eukprot:Phypoly_transcript_07545.p1 GENE.Phypoly_transcript_07545~~Phypoly_transcript_07545.p1  ORF type:complete len:497 (+),score=58.29 Phypoly_transcript_07545:102-1592(+)
MMEIRKEQPPWNPPEAYATSSLEEYMGDLVAFINKYSFLYRFKSIEFFTKSVWDTIPESWKEPLLGLSNEEAAAFPQGKVLKQDWPQSLADFVSDIRKLSMPRNEVNQFPLPTLSQSFQTVNKIGFSLPSLSRNMTAKKVHEVTKLSDLVSHIATSFGSESVDVVDIGSGEGYLGQVLHHDYGMSVVGVDERSEFTEGAQQRAQYIHKERAARERKANLDTDSHSENGVDNQGPTTGGVKHVVATITLDMVPEHFEHIAWPIGPPKQAILVGLHTCGILANAMLRLFMISSPFRAIVDVGCCYYRKLPDSEYELMSNLARQSANPTLQMTPGALKLACEAVCRMSMSSPKEYTYSMESHFFRTLLETALVQHFPTGHQFNIRGLPRKKSSTFQDYSRLAVSRMIKQLPKDSPNSFHTQTQSLTATLDKLYNELQDFYQHVNVTLLLRSIMAPVLESFILLDRFCYLKEGGAFPSLVPLFDEALSPRNMAIIAFKSM